MSLEITKIEDLYQKDRLQEVRQPESYRVTWTRRGSDVVIGSTVEGDVIQITKISHRGQKEFCYKYSLEELQGGKKVILDVLAEGKFKIKARPAPVEPAVKS